VVQLIAAVKLQDRATLPSDKLEREIDDVFFRDENVFRQVELHVIDEPVASDHRPLHAIFEFMLNGLAPSE